LSSAKTKNAARLRALYARQNWGHRSSLRLHEPFCIIGLVEREIRLDLGELGRTGFLDFGCEGLLLCERAKGIVTRRAETTKLAR
jgi:hypothetical protein